MTIPHTRTRTLLPTTHLSFFCFLSFSFFTEAFTDSSFSPALLDFLLFLHSTFYFFLFFPFFNLLSLSSHSFSPSPSLFPLLFLPLSHISRLLGRRSADSIGQAVCRLSCGRHSPARGGHGFGSFRLFIPFRFFYFFFFFSRPLLMSQRRSAQTLKMSRSTNQPLQR